MRNDADEGPWIVEEHTLPREPVDGKSAGERALVRELLSDAMREASFAPCEMRDEARAWLTDEPRFTARYCAEALGIDYEAMLVALRKKWAEADALREAREAARRQQIH